MWSDDSSAGRTHYSSFVQRGQRDCGWFYLSNGRICNPIDRVACTAKKRISHYRLVQLLTTDRQVYLNLIFPSMVLPDWALTKNNVSQGGRKELRTANPLHPGVIADRDSFGAKSTMTRKQLPRQGEQCVTIPLVFQSLRSLRPYLHVKDGPKRYCFLVPANKINRQGTRGGRLSTRQPG